MIKKLLAILCCCITLSCLALPHDALVILDEEKTIPGLELFLGASNENGVLHFTGDTGCRAMVALPAEYANTQEFSYSYWYRLDSIPINDLSESGKRDCAVPLSRNWNWGVRIRPSLDMYAMMILPNNQDYRLGEGKCTAVIYEWTHIAVTYSVKQQAFRFYVNGKLVEESTGSAFQEIRKETAKLNIGSDSELYNAFHGDIANIYFFPRPLDQTEIQELHNKRPNALDTSITALYQEIQKRLQAVDVAQFSEDAREKYAEFKNDLSALAEEKSAEAYQKLMAIKAECQEFLARYPEAVQTVRQWAAKMKEDYSPLAQRVKEMAKNAPVAVSDFVQAVSSEVKAWEQGAITSDYTLCYVVPPTSATPILPDSEMPVSQLGNALACSLTPGEYEGVSFVLKPLRMLKNVRFIMPDLVDAQGNRLSADHLDFKHVLCWYQAGTAWEGVGQSASERKLVPELMVNDPEIIKVDFANKTDYVKLQTPNGPRYVCATHPEARDARTRWNLDITNAEYPVQDAPAPMPTTLLQDENRQFIITIHADADTLPGTYTGQIRALADQGLICTLDISVTVLPFTLAEPKTNYDLNKEFFISLYQVSTMLSNSPGVITPFGRTPKQYQVELENLAKHGITNPLFYQYQTNFDKPASIQDFKTAIQMRLDAGMSCKPLFLSGPEANLLMFVENTPERMAKFRADAKMLLDAVEEVTGHRDVYFYGIDEAYNEVLRKERPIWEEFHKMGAKVLVSSCDTKSVFKEVGDILDLLVHCREPNAEEAAVWHSTGQLIFSYGNPQGGVENPDAYRRNYGLLLYQRNYDGTCTYCNYEAFGNPWDDFDNKDFRDHNLVYPTTNGIIDTIAYEGLREAADDVKYATTLRLAAQKARANGNAELADQAEEYLRTLDTTHADLDQARATIIDYILKLQ